MYQTLLKFKTLSKYYEDKNTRPILPPTKAKTHLTLGIYGNGDYKYNVVLDEDLESHIEYNKTFRFGRLLYVDGERVYDGCYKPEYLDKYDKIAAEFYSHNNVDIHRPTIPYR